MQTKYVGYDCYGHIGVAKGEYFGISKGVDGYCGATKENSFPNYIKGTNPNLKDLALPFSEFCKLNGKEKTEEFDKLIVTTPLDYFKDYADATKEEKELFSKIIHERYCDYIATFEEGKSPVISGYMVKNMVPERLGHAMVYYNRWECLGADCPATVYALANHTGSKDVDYDVVMKTMDEDMAKVGFPIKEKHYAQEVYYCPHVSAKDYADGWYDKLEALQGNKNTYYAGEIISFGDMEDTCAASKDIIGRFF